MTIESFAQVPHPFVFSNYMNVFEWSFPIIATKVSKVFLHLLKMMDEDDENEDLKEKMEVMSKLKDWNNIL